MTDTDSSLAHSMKQSPEHSAHKEEVSIRVATESDVPALVRLINAAFIVERFVFDGDRIGAEETQKLMQSGKFLVASDASGFAGCVYVELREGRGYLGLLAVDPSRQGKGFGRELVCAAEEYFRAEGCSAVDLRIISPRTPLPTFYARLGYVVTGTAPFSPTLKTKVPGHYIVMSKELV